MSSEIVGGRAPAANPPIVSSKLNQASTSPKAKPTLEEQRQRTQPPDPAALAALAAEQRVRMEMNATIREHKKTAAREEGILADIIPLAAAQRAAQLLSEASLASAARRGEAHAAASLISEADLHRAERILSERDEARATD